MPRPAVTLVAALAAFASFSAGREAPSYSASTLLNSASNQTDSFAPNTFISIYGSNLCLTTRAMAASDISGNQLPTILPGTGASVFINRIRVPVYYVSPNQINVLIPADTFPGPAELQVALNGLYGPVANITIRETAPALFQLDERTAIAVHANGDLLTPDNPGHAGEVIVLYATGLGVTRPPAAYNEIPQAAAPIRDTAGFSVAFNGEPIPPARIFYAGAAPGFAGLYQVNLRLPDTVTSDPEIRIQAGSVRSKTGVYIPVR
jgi:uncharacterized protein (TIGR03437 family)